MLMMFFVTQKLYVIIFFCQVLFSMITSNWIHLPYSLELSLRDCWKNQNYSQKSQRYVH